MTTISYNVTEPALRSPAEEWQPHGKQSESTTEWWYLTGLVHDAAGNSYFLVWCPFHFTGDKASPASAGLRRDQRATAALVGFTDYYNNFRIGHFPAAVMNEADTWNPRTNALRFVAGDYSSEWSYNGDNMNLTVASSQLSYGRSHHAECAVRCQPALTASLFMVSASRSCGNRKEGQGSYVMPNVTVVIPDSLCMRAAFCSCSIGSRAGLSKDLCQKDLEPR